MRVFGLPLLLAWGCLFGCAPEKDAGEAPPTRRGPGQPDALGASIAAGGASIVVDADDGGAKLVATLAGVGATVARETGGRRVVDDALGPGFDWTLSRVTDGWEDSVRLPSAPPGDELRYRVELAPGVEGLRVAGGVVELLDARGTPMFRVSNAEIVDALDVRRPVALDVEGCAVDRDPRPPWRRPVVAPGSATCDVVARLPAGVRFPALFDPLWSTAGNMVVVRSEFAAATLDDGTVMIAGGLGFGSRREVEIFDPATLKWSLLGSTAWLPVGARNFGFAKLNDGRVLLSGGRWNINGTTIVKSTVAFDPTTTTWATLPDMAGAREYHTMTVMADGRVLVVGGEDDTSTLATSEIFDPSTDTWSPAPSLSEGRKYHEAIAVGTGVLVVGGYLASVSNDNHSLFFDPSGGGSWSQPATTAMGRIDHVLAALGGGKILMAGGYQNGTFGFADLVEVYDHATDSWSIPMCNGAVCVTNDRVDARALAAPFGGALVTGGCAEEGPYCDGASAGALWFDPTGVPHPAGNLVYGRGKHGMVMLPDGRFVVMGGLGGVDGTVMFPQTEVFSVQPPGQSCALDFECASTHCVDGNCCDAACDGLCEACTFALTGQPNGTCAPIASGTDPDDECVDSGAPACQGNGTCDAGACATYPGPGCDAGACAVAADCASGFCVDGVCCDTACSGNCVACTAAKKGSGADGVCDFVGGGLDPDDECDDGGASSCALQSVCDGAGVCRTGAEACAPSVCVPGGCSESCETDAECAPGAVCVANACVPADALCTGESQALMRDGSTVDCAPYRCTSDGACLTACASVADCAGGTVCDDTDGTCIPVPASTGGDAGCACRSAGDTTHRGDGGSAAWLVALLAVARRRKRR